MGLAKIAADLRADALANPGEIQVQPLPNKAVCSLYAKPLSANEVEWHLRIERPGKLPEEASREHAGWLRELTTFRDERFFNVPAHVVAEMKEKPNRKHYAAAMVWTESVESLRDAETGTAPLPKDQAPIAIAPLPATAEEIRAWAETIGRGVQIRRVNVFTGEY